jgi:2-hydroxymuconate-semialdehyde hydrolase
VIGPLASAGYRLMAVDLPGFGYSDKPGNYTMQSYVDFVAAWLDLHCVDRAAVVGNSMGGAITAAFAGLRPERTAAVVLVDPGGFGTEVTWMLRLAGLRLLRFLPGRLTRRQVRRGMGRIFADPSLVEDEDVDRIIELDEQQGSRAAFLEIAHSAIGLRGVRPEQGVAELARDITAPALVMWGERDRVIPPSHARLAMEVIHDARLVTIENCGHCPQLEVPQRFTEEVLRFLRDVYPPQPPPP